MLQQLRSPRIPHHEALARLASTTVAPVLDDASVTTFVTFAESRGFPVIIEEHAEVEAARFEQPAALLDAAGFPVGILSTSSGRIVLEMPERVVRTGVDAALVREVAGVASDEPWRVARVGERLEVTAQGDHGDPHEENDHHPRTVAEALRSLVHLERDDIGLALIFGASAGLVALAGPIATQGIVTAVSFGTLQQPLVVIAGLLFVVLALSAALSFAQQFVVEVLARRLFVRVALDVEAVAQPVDLVHGAAGGPAPHFAYVHEVFSLQKSASTLLVDGAATLMKLLFAFLLLGFYHPYLLAFDAVCIVALVIVLRAPMRRAWRLALETSAKKYEVVHDLESLVLPVVPGAHHGAPRVAAHVERWLEIRGRSWRQLQYHNVGAMAVGVLMVSGLLLFGGFLVLQGQLSLGQLVAAELVVSDAALGTGKLGKLMASMYDAAVSAEKLRKLTGHALPSFAQPNVPARVRLLPVRAPRAVQTLGRLLAAGFGLFVLVCIFVPWQQTARGQGRVIAFAPGERTQELTTPVDGRVIRWEAVEGQRVKKDDVVAVLGDNDPAILDRIRTEAESQRARLAAAHARVAAIDERILALTSSREAAMSAAEHRATMARERIRNAEQSLEAARATAMTASLQEERQKALFSEGLASKRTVEVAELDKTRTATEVNRAEVTLSVSRRDAQAIESDRERVEHDTLAALNDARGSLEVARGDVASATAELARIEARLARQDNLVVKAPLDGTIHRVVPRGSADFVKAGETLATIVPDTEERAVELLIDGNDVPLVQRSEDVRLQFEGWPAIQFSGWPSVAVGTFGGKVRFVDATDDGSGKFRVVVVPAEQWPEGAYLRQGARAQGWVLMQRVSVGYELWRQFNAFPPAMPHVTGKGDAAKGKAEKGK
jgi:multidrug efflux pump subunit AcrA (membrane-fusion protein)